MYPTERTILNTLHGLPSSENVFQLIRLSLAYESSQTRVVTEDHSLKTYL